MAGSGDQTGAFVCGAARKVSMASAKAAVAQNAMEATIGSEVPSKKGPEMTIMMPPASICSVPPSADAMPAIGPWSSSAITMVGAWYVMFRSVGLYNTYLGLILAHATQNLPIAIWLMSTFLREVPHELEEAARIDGCGTLKLLLRVVVPVVMPGIAATTILVFIHSWNEFVVALNLTAQQTATVPVAIAQYAQENETLYGEMAAGAVLSTLPALLLILIGQRQIVRGLTAGAVK